MPTPNRTIRGLTLALCGMMMAGAAFAAGPALTRITTSGGDAFADGKGMALYTFDKDSAGQSACTGDCAAKWPPMMAPADARAEGNFAPIQRADGTMQWAMNGKPLYRFAKDTKPGQTAGDGVGGVWHLAK